MNSTTKIIAGVAVLALLFAAVGYATYSGTARTYNEDNSATVNYVSISAGNWDPFSAEEVQADFDSYAYNGGLVYKLSGAESKEFGDDTYCAKKLNDAAKTYTITDGRADKTTNLQLSITSTEAIGSANLLFIIEITYGTDVVKEVIFNGTATPEAVTLDGLLSGDATSADLTMNMYVAYTADMEVPTTYVGVAKALPASGEPEQGYEAGWGAIANFAGSFADVDFKFAVTESA